MERTNKTESAIGKFDIISGPSKFDLMGSLMFRGHSKQIITFNLGKVEGENIVVVGNLLLLMQEDGIRIGGEYHDWRFILTNVEVNGEYGRSAALNESFRGTYSTKTRIGTLELIGTEGMWMIHAMLGATWAREHLGDEYSLPEPALSLEEALKALNRR